MSITVIGPDVLEADRFATAAFAMGKDGIMFIEQLPGFEGYSIDPERHGNDDEWLRRVHKIDMYIKAVVHTSAKKELLKEISADHFEISVKEKPIQNSANRRVIALIAEHFNTTFAKVRIINGHHSPSKLISVNRD